MVDSIKPTLLSPANQNGAPTPYAKGLSDFEEMFFNSISKNGEKPTAHEIMTATVELKRNPLATLQRLRDEMMAELRGHVAHLQEVTLQFDIALSQMQVELDQAAPDAKAALELEIEQKTDAHDQLLKSLWANIQELRENIAILDAQIEEMKHQLGHDEEAAEKGAQSANVVLMSDFFRDISPFNTPSLQ